MLILWVINFARRSSSLLNSQLSLIFRTLWWYIFYLISARSKVKSKKLVLKRNNWADEVLFSFIKLLSMLCNLLEKKYSIQQKIAVVFFNQQIWSLCISCVFISFSEWKGSVEYLNIFSYFRQFSERYSFKITISKKIHGEIAFSCTSDFKICLEFLRAIFLFTPLEDWKIDTFNNKESN